MAHPFTKFLEAAVAKSTAHENMVLMEAQKLIEKGYRNEEICGVLQKMAKGRIDDGETEIIQEALDELCEEEEEECLS